LPPFLFCRGLWGQKFQNEIVSWHGPLKSSFGYHLVLITGIYEQEVTPFTAISDQVLKDYRQSRQDSARQRYLANLLLNYEILIEQQ